MTETTTTTIPAGKWMPEEPTADMWTKGAEELEKWRSTPFHASKNDAAVLAYRAMYRAAPSPAPAAPSVAQPSRLQRALNDPTGWCPKCGCGHDGVGFAHLETCPAQPSQGGSVSEAATAASLAELIEAMDRYQQAADTDAPAAHRAMMQRARSTLSAARASAPAAPEVAPILWCVHHIGPDDLHPVESYEAAVKMANGINDQSEKFNFGHKPDSINYVYSRAYPAIWTGTPESHAEWLEKRRAAGEEANG